MSHPPPPSDPLQPYDPTRAFGTSPTGQPVSGEPDSSQPQDQPTPGSPPWAGPAPQPPNYQPPNYQPPNYQPPNYQPGYAQPSYPPAGPEYPPTATYPLPEQPGYPPPGHPPTATYPPPVGPGYPPAHPGPAPKRSLTPLVAVILAVTLLLCGGTAVAGTLIVRNITNRAKEAAKSLPTVPTELPGLPNVPTELPDVPTEVPQIPGLPTDSNGKPVLPGLTDKTITVMYEVTGDGPADITYVEKIDKTPKRVKKAKLPWRKEITMTGVAFVSVVAIRTETGSGAISCSTTVDGAQVAQRTRDGSFAVASCSKFVY